MSTVCNEFEQDLVLYHYGDLSADDRDRLATHLHACPGCATYLKELAALLPLTMNTEEPGEEFWQSYSREMRHRLADFQEKKSWRHALQAALRPWTLPALAGTAVVALAVTLNTASKTTSVNDAPAADTALMEVLPMAENLELFNNMDVLENIEVLEVMEASANEAA
ncbi:MAG TPA: zf-HC2 domain-containing protein [Gammaproteobacteria bacterium]|nr:zf-HC2 domain-containing protein [Gammaproteobacteria bacterium]